MVRPCTARRRPPSRSDAARGNCCQGSCLQLRATWFQFPPHAATGGVMGMVQQISNDAEAREAKTIRSEEDAQKAYGTLRRNKRKDINNKSETKAKAEADLGERPVQRCQAAMRAELQHRERSPVQSCQAACEQSCHMIRLTCVSTLLCRATSEKTRAELPRKPTVSSD